MIHEFPAGPYFRRLRARENQALWPECYVPCSLCQGQNPLCDHCEGTGLVTKATARMDEEVVTRLAHKLRLESLLSRPSLLSPEEHEGLVKEHAEVCTTILERFYR